MTNKDRIDTGAAYIWKDNRAIGEDFLQQWAGLDEAEKEIWRQILKESIKFSKKLSELGKQVSPYEVIELTLINTNFNTNIYINLEEKEVE